MNHSIKPVTFAALSLAVVFSSHAEVAGHGGRTGPREDQNRDVKVYNPVKSFIELCL
jgi:hypothetical protein